MSMSTRLCMNMSTRLRISVSPRLRLRVRVRKALGSLAILALTLAAGLATADETSFTPQQQQGKRLYNHICVYCHSPGVWGTNRLSKRMDKEHAVLENRTDLTAAAIQTIVRTGIGSMPPLRKSELSDADVAAIAAYLTRQNR